MKLLKMYIISLGKEKEKNGSKYIFPEDWESSV